jgi:hypothetical protein
MPSQPAPPRPAVPPGPRPRPLRRALPRLGVLVLLLALGLEAARVLAGSNFHVVVPGYIYRCSQPSDAFLEEAVKTYKIRTVINLRGCCDPSPWYLDECRALARLDVAQEDVGLSACRLPSTQAARELVRVLDRSEYPILIHCNRGIDRTGLVSALALLLHTDASLSAARGQLGPRYGHLALGRTGNMDRFFDLYEEWLVRQGQAHSREAFRRWLEYEYCPGECSALIEPLSPPASPALVRAHQPLTVRLRCHNTSVKPWTFKPGDTAGIHLMYFLTDAHDQPLAAGRAGRFHAVVHPGDSIDLTLALPALPGPGRYLLRADLADEQHAVFFQAGSQPLLMELEAP